MRTSSSRALEPRPGRQREGNGKNVPSGCLQHRSVERMPEPSVVPQFSHLYNGNCLELNYRIDGRNKRVNTCSIAGNNLDPGLAVGSQYSILY